MSLDARTLLSGPRGRRLCLAAATPERLLQAPEVAELWSVLFYAAHHRESARGQGGTMFGWNIPDPLPEPSVEDVAAALDAIPLASLGAVDLLDALGASVDNARYWQEPDGTDELLQEPRLVGALERIAEYILALPLVEWWSEPLAAEQWAVAFRDPCVARPDPSTASHTLESWSAAMVTDELVAQRDLPADATANYSGTWWSKPPSELASTTRFLPEAGPVGLWLVEDRFDQEPADIRPLFSENAPRVFEITGAASWAELCRRYPFDVTAGRRHDWYRATGRIGQWVIPNWALVARDFDAVHLSVAAYLAAAGVAIPVNDDVASVIAGWNPDETYWLADVSWGSFSETSWMRDDRTQRWHPTPVS